MAGRGRSQHGQTRSGPRRDDEPGGRRRQDRLGPKWQRDRRRCNRRAGWTAQRLSTHRLTARRTSRRRSRRDMRRTDSPRRLLGRGRRQHSQRGTRLRRDGRGGRRCQGGLGHRRRRDSCRRYLSSLTVPVGGDATAALGRTARAGRRRAGLAAGSLSDRSLPSRGQGMSPKWPAAANTAPPASSRPKAASTVDQRNPAAARWLGTTAACSRCLIRSRSPAVSSSSGSAARIRDASGPRCRSLAESVVLLSIFIGCCLRPTGHRKAELARGAPSPRRRWS